MGESNPNLLVLVIDMSPAQKYVREAPKSFFGVVDTCLTFANIHRSLASENEVAIIASHLTQSQYLYPLELRPGDQAPKVRQQDGQYEVFLELEKIVRTNVKRVLVDKSFIPSELQQSNSSVPTSAPASCLASALGRALCYINRREKEIPNNQTLTSRICTISGSCESTAQYMAFMNVFFTAQKKGVAIDACILGQYATLLSQGADITGGTCLRPPNGPLGLLQYLMWVFLPDISTRKSMVLPPPVPVDYRAACFCHRQLISLGFVCSVCLSIFCKFSPICSTCHAIFKVPPMILPPPKDGSGKKAKSPKAQH